MLLRQLTSLKLTERGEQKRIRGARKVIDRGRRYSTAVIKQLQVKIEKPAKKCDAFKAFLPYLVFFGLLGVGALVVHASENFFTRSDDVRTKGKKICIGNHGFSAAVFYILSACSTIGYGAVYPCTIAGKLIGLLYAFFGIPFVLVLLSDVGLRLCRLVSAISVSLRLQTARNALKRNQGYRRARTYSPNNNDVNDITDTTCSTTHTEFTNSLVNGSEDRKSDTSTTDTDLPIWIGVGLILFCVSMCTVYYISTHRYPFAESLYYALFTFLAGDLTTVRYSSGIPIYLVIFLGFSMFSLTYRIVQKNINNAMARIRDKAAKALQKQRKDIATGKIKAEDVNVDEMLDQILGEESGGGMRQRILSNFGVEQLKQEAAKVVEIAHQQTQTQREMTPILEEDTDDKGTMIDYCNMFDNETQATVTKGTACIGVCVESNEEYANTISHVKTDKDIQLVSWHTSDTQTPIPHFTESYMNTPAQLPPDTICSETNTRVITLAENESNTPHIYVDDFSCIFPLTTQ